MILVLLKGVHETLLTYSAITDQKIIVMALLPASSNNQIYSFLHKALFR